MQMHWNFFAVLCLSGAGFVWGGQPWDSAFFADTRVILAAASQIAPAEHPEVLILLDDHRYLVHSDGRIDLTFRRVYRVEDQDAVDEWAAIEQSYQPWYQQAPQLRARVIGRNGTVRWLDSKTIADAPAQQFDNNIFSDERSVRAPLPGVEAGAIVEYEVVLLDKTPLLSAGVTTRVIVPQGVPVERFHTAVETEGGIELSTATQLIPEAALRRATVGKGNRVECDLGPLASQKDLEWNLPYDVASVPYLAFSTGRSWQSVASRYEAIVNERIDKADLRTQLEGIDLNAKPAELAAKLTSRLHASVRYTGVEFEEAAIVPNAPAETLKRGYGDCKDKAALLVAMLRAAGLKADVALLDAGAGLDVDKGLAGLGIFNHAIVYVDATPPLWIDATATDTRVGFLPSMDQGRLALVANSKTTALVKTPESLASENWERIRVDARMSEFGTGAVHVFVEASGAGFEASARAMYGGPEKKSDEQTEKWAKNSFASKLLGAHEVARRDDMSGPFRMKLDALDCQTVQTAVNEGAVAMNPWTVFAQLPWVLTKETPDEKDAPRRKSDFVFNEAYQMEFSYLIHPPALYKVAKLPESIEVNLGAAKFSKRYAAQADGTVEAVYRFDSGKRRITAAEYEEMRAGLARYATRAPEVLSFIPKTAEFLALGQTSKAVAALRTQIKADPNNAMLHIRLSAVLDASGFGDAALAEAKKATELDPKSAPVAMGLATAFERDSFGRLRQGDWNPDEARKNLRRSVEIDPTNYEGRMELAILLEYNRLGWRYGSGSRVEESLAMYRELMKVPQYEALIRETLAIALLRTGKYNDARELLQKLPGEKSLLLQDTITAIQDGPGAVAVSAQGAYPDVRQRGIHLGSVAQTLMQIRQYEPAAALMKAAARLLPNNGLEARAEMIGKLKRWQSAVLTEDDPGYPAQKLFLAVMQGELGPELSRMLASRRIRSEVSDGQMKKLQSMVGTIRQAMVAQGLEEEALLDFLVSLVVLEKTGDDQRGYRIVLMSPGTPDMLTSFVVKEDGKYRVLGGTRGMEGVGSLVLELLEKKDLKGAQWWLDQAVRDTDARPDGTGRPAVVSLWSGVREESRGPAAIRTAAAALIGSSTGSAKASAILEEMRVKASNVTEKSEIDKALCETYEKAKDWDKLMSTARRLESAKFLHEEGFRYFLRGATKAEKWKELEAEARAALAANADHVIAMRAMAVTRLKQNDAAGAQDWVKKLTGSKFAGRDEYIFAAWFEIGQNKIDSVARDRFKNSANHGPADKEYAYTLAFLEAMLGSTDEALPLLTRAVGSFDVDALPPAAWAVHGKICGQYGLWDCAKASFERARMVPEDEADNVIPREWVLKAIGN